MNHFLQIFISLAACFLVVLGAHAAPLIFGAAHLGPDGQSTLYHIDASTGQATAIGTGIGFERVSGLAFNPATGVLYGTGEFPADPVDVNNLITIDINTGVGTAVGPTGVAGFAGVFSGDPSFPGVFSDLSFRPSDGTLFGFSFPGQWVATIDLNTGTATQLAFESILGDRGIEANDGNGLAFLGSGLLLHAGSEGSIDAGGTQAPSCAWECPSALHAIDLDTSLATTLVTLNFPILPGFDNDLDVPRVSGMDFDSESDLLYASIVYGVGGNRSSFLGTINPTTGDVELIGTTVLGMDAIAIVPIPAAAWLFASGLGLLIWIRRTAI